MKVLLFVTVVVGLSFLLTSACSRARRDWDYELQLMLVLGYLDWLDRPQGGLMLSEVLLAAPFASSTFDELVLVLTAQAGELPILLHLDEPLGGRAELCARWCDATTPLLLANDDQGAILHGPGGQLLGRLVRHGCAGPGWLESMERR
jgi:hypothetical protein